MDDGTRSSVLIVIALVFMALYFAVCETSFASVPKARIRARADKGERSAENALYIIEHFDQKTKRNSNITPVRKRSFCTIFKKPLLPTKRN